MVLHSGGNGLGVIVCGAVSFMCLGSQSLLVEVGAECGLLWEGVCMLSQRCGIFI